MPTLKTVNGADYMIDAEDLHLVDGRRVFAKRLTPGSSTRYAFIPGNSRWTRLHVLIMQPPAGMDVDHRNGNGLDNRRANLRVTTHALNCANSRKRTTNTSGFKGVSFDRRRGNWRAYIVKDYKQRGLGRFSTPEAAAAAYDAAAVALFGEFARTNVA